MPYVYVNETNEYFVLFFSFDFETFLIFVRCHCKGILNFTLENSRIMGEKEVTNHRMKKRELCQLFL